MDEQGNSKRVFVFQKKPYFTLVSNQTTTKLTTKIHRDNLSGINIYDIEEQLQSQQKEQ